MILKITIIWFPGLKQFVPLDSSLPVLGAPSNGQPREIERSVPITLHSLTHYSLITISNGQLWTTTTTTKVLPSSSFPCNILVRKQTLGSDSYSTAPRPLGFAPNKSLLWSFLSPCLSSQSAILLPNLIILTLMAVRRTNLCLLGCRGWRRDALLASSDKLLWSSL